LKGADSSSAWTNEGGNLIEATETEWNTTAKPVELKYEAKSRTAHNQRELIRRLSSRTVIGEVGRSFGSDHGSDSGLTWPVD